MIDGEVLNSENGDYSTFYIDIINVPKGLTGELKVYLNDNFYDGVNITDDNYNIEYSFLYEGYRMPNTKLNYRVEYSGDDYFKPANKSASLMISDFAVNIPSKVIPGYDDKIEIKTYSYTMGCLEIYIDDELFVRRDIGTADERSSTVGYDFSLDHLNPGMSYDVKISLTHKNRFGITDTNITRYYTVEVCSQTADYVEFPLWSSSYIFDDADTLPMYAPKIDLDVKIDGNPADCTYTKDGYYLIDISGLKLGFHDITVSYEGDSIFLKNTFRKTIFIDAVADVTQYYNYYQSKPAQFDLTLPDYASGNLTMKIKRSNETDYHFYRTFPVTGGIITLELPTEHIGTFDYTFDFDGNCEMGNLNNLFEVYSCADWKLPKYSTEINETRYLNLTLPEDAWGNLTVALTKTGENHTQYITMALTNGTAAVELPTDHIGYYNYTASFTGNYEVDELYGDLFISDNADWSLTDSNVNLSEECYLNLELPKDASGKVTVQIYRDGESFANYTEFPKDGNVKIKLPTEHAGNYEFNASFDGNPEIFNYTNHYTVMGDGEITCPYPKVDYMSKQEISIKLPKDATGKLTLELKREGEENYTLYKSADVVNGKASIIFPTDEFTEFEYRAGYSGNCEVRNITGRIRIGPLYYLDGIFHLVNATGDLYISLDNELITAITVNATHVDFDVRDYFRLAEYGRFNALFFSNGDVDDYYEIFVDVDPVFDIEIRAKDVSMYYGDKSSFVINVLRNGEPVGAGHVVSVKIGSKTYSPSTDANGVAKLTISKLPGKYTVRTTYKTKTVTNKLTVKKMLTLKKVKVRKSAKKLVLTAKLAKKLKGKKITFRFNSKKYVIKTNKKGVAKLKIKKSVLKRLKVGKKITYGATYIKETKKIKVKVRR